MEPRKGQYSNPTGMTTNGIATSHDLKYLKHITHVVSHDQEKQQRPTFESKRLRTQAHTEAHTRQHTCMVSTREWSQESHVHVASRGADLAAALRDSTPVASAMAWPMTLRHPWWEERPFLEFLEFGQN